MIIILELLISCFTTCVLFHQSPALIVLYHACSLLVITYISLPALVCLYSQHGFQYMLFWFGYIDTRVLILARHLAYTIPLTGEFLTTLDPHVQISEFGACGFSRLLIRDVQQKRGSSADRLRSYPSGPPARSRVFPLWLMSALCTVHYCISPCILAIAPIGDVISL